MEAGGVADLPLIVIAGPTASGKTALAIGLAQKFGGEIVCADSRTIYRGMDIGTAKPTSAEQALVPHWGIDLVEPGERFSAADFKKYANEKIAEIRGRGKVPFLVGGTGLYIDAVVFDFTFGPVADANLRDNFQSMSVMELQNYCKSNNIELPENSQNHRYLVRAIERQSISTKRRDSSMSNSHVVGIATDRQILRTRIELRSEQIFSSGVVEEATLLGSEYGWQNEAMTGNIYPLVRKFVDGFIDEDELRRQFFVSDWRLAKRQMTWLRRNSHLLWCDLSAAEQYLSNHLANR